MLNHFWGYSVGCGIKYLGQYSSFVECDQYWSNISYRWISKSKDDWTRI